MWIYFLLVFLASVLIGLLLGILTISINNITIFECESWAKYKTVFYYKGKEAMEVEHTELRMLRAAIDNRIREIRRELPVGRKREV